MITFRVHVYWTRYKIIVRIIILHCVKVILISQNLDDHTGNICVNTTGHFHSWQLESKSYVTIYVGKVFRNACIQKWVKRLIKSTFWCTFEVSKLSARVFLSRNVWQGFSIASRPPPLKTSTCLKPEENKG